MIFHPIPPGDVLREEGKNGAPHNPVGRVFSILSLGEVFFLLSLPMKGGIESILVVHPDHRPRHKERAVARTSYRRDAVEPVHTRPAAWKHRRETRSYGHYRSHEKNHQPQHLRIFVFYRFVFHLFVCF